MATIEKSAGVDRQPQMRWEDRGRAAQLSADLVMEDLDWAVAALADAPTDTHGNEGNAR